MGVEHHSHPSPASRDEDDKHAHDALVVHGVSSLELPAGLPFRKKVLQLRFLGYSVPEISEILGSSESSVQYHLNAAISSSSSSERLTLVREAEIIKLEELENAFYPHALSANDKAAKVVLDVMDRRSKLLGIDKAVPQTGGNLTLIQILSQMPDADGMRVINE
jgi:hypothetical protein